MVRRHNALFAKISANAPGLPTENQKQGNIFNVADHFVFFPRGKPPRNKIQRLPAFSNSTRRRLPYYTRSRRRRKRPARGSTQKIADFFVLRLFSRSYFASISPPSVRRSFFSLFSLRRRDEFRSFKTKTSEYSVVSRGDARFFDFFP